MDDKIKSFLTKFNMLPESVDPVSMADKFKANMLSGINGNVVDMPMIPTNLTADGELPKDTRVIAIDAGGTNFRCGVVSFSSEGADVTDLFTCEMPGHTQSVTWEEFIAFLVDSITPVLDKSDKIGFCFSYSADITENCDGRVNCIDKEVKITGCEGKLIGVSINNELMKRGLQEKRVIILNDTVAALLGGSSAVDKSKYSSLAGMICGTGFNICANYRGMVYNLEAGFFNDINRGEADILADAASDVPGEKQLEKMVSGAYLGLVCKELIMLAGKEGLISKTTADRIYSSPLFTSSVADAMACGCDDNEFSEGILEMPTLSSLCSAVFERSARSVCGAMIGIMKLQKDELNSNLPACFCAEGSLISKSYVFKKFLYSSLEEYAINSLDLHFEIIIGKDTTLPGAAAATLLNT